MATHSACINGQNIGQRCAWEQPRPRLQSLLRTCRHRVAPLTPALQDAHGRNRRIFASSCSPAQPSTALPPLRVETVGDVMTKTNLYKATTETSLDEALELLVSHNVTGLPVVDADNRVVGVVSDYDMMALEGVAEAQSTGTGIFPEVELSWATFNQVQRIIDKTAGKTVGDVMTADPVVVRAETNMAAAAKILLEQRMRRLPVVDAEGRLLGIFTRSDVLRSVYKARTARKGL